MCVTAQSHWLNDQNSGLELCSTERLKISQASTLSAKPRARARERVVPISELVFEALSLETTHATARPRSAASPDPP
jgi:hypothetical protein